MIIVIQCAGRKCLNAGSLWTASREKIQFVADPAKAPARPGHVYARPDDLAGDGLSWRDKLLAYQRSDNPHALLKAYQLYNVSVYEKLVHRFGEKKVFILSAGWGLIRADFLTPSYDITFSKHARKKHPYLFRDPKENYRDFCQLDKTSDEPIYFFGGQDYILPFTALTAGTRGERVVYYNSKHPPIAPGCRLERYVTTAKTNWHYSCAQWFLSKFS
ncbi:hypothetical protein CGX12_17945 [Zobellella denitrificans]|uniref:hypothetical protein n=1 Tax=Zobellella denitrificans TaxID=347534 RepID=UPI000B8BC118|nr:hypothetical protein [Zobellella denitrificans]OXS13757.1 hypothetical protein CGX12_17945 [Zobellella denitrificans]